jgi:hypothetical protein
VGVLKSCRKTLRTFEIFTHMPLARREEEQGCRRPNSGEGGGGGAEGLAYGHQGLTAHPWVDLGGRGGDRR